MDKKDKNKIEKERERKRRRGLTKWENEIEYPNKRRKKYMTEPKQILCPYNKQIKNSKKKFLG